MTLAREVLASPFDSPVNSRRQGKPAIITGCRVPQSERDLVVAAARKVGLPLSHYVRRAVMQAVARDFAGTE